MECFEKCDYSTKCRQCEYLESCIKAKHLEDKRIRTSAHAESVSAEESFLNLMNDSSLDYYTAEQLADTLRFALDLFEALYYYKPRTFWIIRDKLQHPEWSYSQIGERYGCDKQLVDTHITKAIKIVPELRESILIDHCRVAGERTGKKRINEPKQQHPELGF